MAINLEQETLITLTEAAKLLPGVNGKRINVSTLWRWCRKGTSGVNLEYLRVGTKIVTSANAMGRFLESLSKRDQLSREKPDIRLPRRHHIKTQRRQKAIEEANVILARARL